jgi:hypothetical protein
MYIEAVPNRGSPPAILLRESYRQDGKVRKRTLCNLSDWPVAHIEGLRGVLKGGIVIPAGQDALTVTRTLPHGHVAAALGTARKIGLDRILGPAGNRCRDLVLALLVGRILDPASKLATARALSPATATSSLGEMLGLGEVDEDELYTALDWLLERQPAIEATLAKRHLGSGMLVLYDVSSSYMEGRCCPLAKRGYSRDGRKGTLQIIYGLLCAPDGCPIAIEVFEGNTADPMTLTRQIDKLKQRFGLQRVVLVGDRGMITEARLRSRGCWPAVRCSCRCSISATWPRSPHATFPASAWWSAAIPTSPPSVPASARTCSPPPSAIWPAFRPLCAAAASRCAAPPRSRSRSAR